MDGQSEADHELGGLLCLRGFGVHSSGSVGYHKLAYFAHLS